MSYTYTEWSFKTYSKCNVDTERSYDTFGNVVLDISVEEVEQDVEFSTWVVVERESLPACLAITAESNDGEIMGLRHRALRVEGVQFHPEALLTEHGHKMLQNFIEGATS